MRSADTFDLGYCLSINTHLPPLLDVSFSLHSLPTLSSSDSIPQFPDSSLAHKVHLDTYLSLHQPSHLGCFSTVADRSNDGIGALLSAPTAPRLRNMMREPLHIKKWLNGLVPTPTVPIRNASPHGSDLDWKAEGSLYTPDEFAETLKKSRFLRAPVDNKRTHRAKLNRSALVIEKERVNQVSAKVPTSSVGSEDVLNSRRLGDFFTADTDPNQISTSPTDYLDFDRSPSTPCLMVSTSDAAFHISLESSSDLFVHVPTTLAARRGKNMLPHLILDQNHKEESYPSIPTAFLGAPPERWLLEHTRCRENTQVDLQFMLSTLQSQRIAEPFLSGATNTSCLQNKAIGDSGSDSDEWAFADAFVSEYGDLSLGSSGHETTSLNVFYTGITGSDTSMMGENESSLSQRTFPSFAELSVSSIVASPQRPILRTPPQEVRGILKGCRNVRFASLPNRHLPEQQLEQQSWSDKPMTRVIPMPVQEMQYSKVRGSRHASSVTSGTLVVRSRPPNPFKPVHNQGYQTVRKADLDNRPVSSFFSKVGSSSVLAVSASIQQRHSAAHHPAIASKMPVAPASRLRNVTNAKSTGNRENEIRPNLVNRKTRDENVGRRDSSICQSRDILARKRKQGPLRNILTRFK
ncbi:hypothetical protein AX15_006536 [Amanita polypyramis BW_CC]|nr:hypothetical protein AX15_006536 [Amanita polypyramis BW_CC]